MARKNSPLTHLMHAVLDEEASSAEARELEMRLAADPPARAEFEEWKRLFEALHAMPKEHPAEGLVASITSALPPSPSIQPFAGRRVLGGTQAELARRDPLRSITMTDPTRRRIFIHRRAWLGAGLAAAVAVVVAQIAFDFPLPKDVVGTVIPAQRYRAAQNGSEQVQVGAPGGQAVPVGTVSEAGRAQADMKADRAAAEMKADRATAEMKADRATAEMKADRATAEMKADRATAEMKADRATAEMKADRTTAEMKADRATAEMKADRAAAEMKADRSSQQ
ncbi:MAG TPA: hypothetical protein VMU47_07000 [Caldimonas sp.]|nr:hypothetical protein [Caldimonas sp.]